MFRELWGFPHADPPTNGVQQPPYAAGADGLRRQTSILWKPAQLRPWGRAKVSQTTDCTNKQRKQIVGVQISHRRRSPWVLFEQDTVARYWINPVAMPKEDHDARGLYLETRPGESANAVPHYQKLCS